MSNLATIKRKQVIALAALRGRGRRPSNLTVTARQAGGGPLNVLDDETGFVLIEEDSEVEAVLKLATLAARSPGRLGPVVIQWLNAPQSALDRLELKSFADTLSIAVSEEIANAYGYTTGEAPPATPDGGGGFQGVIGNLIKQWLAGLAAGGGIKNAFNTVKVGAGAFGLLGL